MTTIITSPHNPHLKDLRRLHRRRERDRAGLFIAEGEDLIGAAIHAGRPAVEGYRTPGTTIAALQSPSARQAETTDGERFHEVDAHALAAVSTLGSGTRAIGVYRQQWSAPCGPLCVYLHGVGDPGNVGAVLRSAHAFGASCVALGPDCADPHSPKAVRASMGAVFAVALARVQDVAELPGEHVALLAHGGDPLWQLCAKPLTLLVGGEREGLPEEIVQRCPHAAHIPIHGAESLNAAMAATVALYEMTRPSSRVPAS